MPNKPTKVHPDIDKEFSNTDLLEDDGIQADPSEFYDHRFKPYKGQHPYIKQGINVMKNFNFPEYVLSGSSKNHVQLFSIVCLVLVAINSSIKLSSTKDMLAEADAQIVLLEADIDSLTDTANTKIATLNGLVQGYEEQIQMVSDANGSTSVLSPDQVDIVWSPEYVMSFDISDCRYLRFGKNGNKLKLKCMPNGEPGQVSML